MDTSSLGRSGSETRNAAWRVRLLSVNLNWLSRAWLAGSRK